MEKEANVLSVDEVLETEKQEKINEVIQNAKTEENDLHLEAMAAIPPEQMFDEIWKKLEDHGKGSKREKYLKHDEEIELLNWTHVRDIDITQKHVENSVQWKRDEIHAKYKCKYNKDDSTHSYDIYLRKKTTQETDNNWKTVTKYEIEWKDSDQSWRLTLDTDLLSEDLETIRELTDVIAFKKRQNPEKKRFKKPVFK